MSGVQFPLDSSSGLRPSTGPAKRIWSAAFSGIGEEEAVQALVQEKNWRKRYADHLVPLTERSAKTPEITTAVARQGLEAVHSTFEFVRGDATLPLSTAMKQFTDVPLTGEVQAAEGNPGPNLASAFSVPGAQGVEQGDDEALLKWFQGLESAGQVEPDVVKAVRAVQMNREAWVASLREDTYFVLLGATSELCPFESLLGMGLKVIGIARPNAKRQLALIDACRQAPAGASLTLPVINTSVDNPSALEDADFLASVSGADILTHAPEIANWLISLYPGKRLVIGSYIYLDGANHVRASVAMDAVIQRVIEARPSTGIMILGSPAVVYPVPAECAEESNKRRKKAPFWHKVASLALGPFRPNTRPATKLEAINPKATNESTEMFMYNGISNVQGPNYMLAKTLQNWRVMLARETSTDKEHARFSVNMAPVCATESVMHVAKVARAVRGMKTFAPLTYFEPGTARQMMAIMLIYDMCAPESEANPHVALRNPLDIFASIGVHGGLWRAAYAQDSIGKTAYVADLCCFAPK